MSRNFFWNRSGSPWGPFAVVFASDTLIVSSDRYGTNPYAWQDVSGTPSWGYVAGAETCAIERDALGWKITLSGPLAATLRGPTDPTNPCGSYAGDGIAATVALPEGTLTPVDYTYAQPWNDDTGTPFADAPFYPGDAGSTDADTVTDTLSGGLPPWGGPASPITLASYTSSADFGYRHETDSITIGSGGSVQLSAGSFWGGDASAAALCVLIDGASQTADGKSGPYALLHNSGACGGQFAGDVGVLGYATFASATTTGSVVLCNAAASVEYVPSLAIVRFATAADYANYGLTGPGMPDPSVVEYGVVYDGGQQTGTYIGPTNVITPLPSGLLTLEQYASYSLAHDNAIQVNVPAGCPDLTGANVHLWIALRSGRGNAAMMPPVLDVAGCTIVGPLDAPTAIICELSGTATASLDHFSSGAYGWQLVAYYSASNDQVPLTAWADLTSVPGASLATS